MKTIIQKTIWLYFVAVGALACSCSKDEGQLPEEAAGCEVVQEFTNTSVQITEPTTWTADRVYLFKSTHVIIESELTIEPGTVMKFDNASAMYIRRGKNQARIIANGTPDKRIVFTSYTDSRHCGNTPTDGDASQPKRGDWGGIAINAGNKHSFTYVDILYAGGSAGEGMHSAIELNYDAGADFTFDHCVVAHTRGEVRGFSKEEYRDPRSPGIYAAFSADFQFELPNFEKFRFTNNVFYDNDVPLIINSYYSVDASNKFHNPDNPAEKNYRNVIHMFGWAHQEGDVTWGHTEVPYAYTGGYTHIGKSQHAITIGPNVIVKFPGVEAGLNSWDDIRVINLHPTAILTSYLDDAHGGDSNGDGTNSSPAKSDWKGFLARTSVSNDVEVWATGDNILYADRP
ncbi:hypothetical protein FXV77_03950 [Sphingobacterium phlebotomi]|uniref:Parallel beta helix pectate lyase-like protein n=1 Tax=Sphingobacterium phlebotomi TaxID=2605433 RepID=A0A5D4HHU6_9SPHI|nr:hypothetical protein [Sphingobacterium phlebotomi]TYR38440.1 hypothetical protein FXV77_03950 [Sphingobacterium phlebotomi]